MVVANETSHRAAQGGIGRIPQFLLEGGEGIAPAKGDGIEAGVLRQRGHKGYHRRDLLIECEIKAQISERLRVGDPRGQHLKSCAAKP